MKKYKLTENSIQYKGKTLYQIRALKDFTDVRKGDLGGYVESEANLSHEGDCWAYNSSYIFDNALVCDNAQIWNSAEICGNAKICGNALIFSQSTVSQGEFSKFVFYKIYEYDSNQVVYSEKDRNKSVKIEYKGNVWNLDETIIFKEKIIEKTLQLYKISKTDNDLLEGLL